MGEEGIVIDTNGLFDWAISDPGPSTATNGGINGGKGIVPHSAEGHWDSLQALHDFHWQRATAFPGLQASWGATNLQDGRFVQHYSIHAQTWTSGAGYPNNNFFAFENEGVAGEPLTQPQIDNIVRVIRELSALQGWTPERPLSEVDYQATLYEHNECTRWGALATACPSGRIPWKTILEALEPVEEEEMPFLVWCPDEGAAYIVGPNGAKPVYDRKDYDAFEKAYGAPKLSLTPLGVKALQ